MGSRDNHAIPVVDFKDGGLDVETKDLNFDTKAVEELGRKLLYACSTAGFVYLRNHGIHDTEVEDTRNKVGEFFNLPTKTKNAYQRTSSNTGWLDLKDGKTASQRPGELNRESYNVIPGMGDSLIGPDDVVPGFRQNVHEFFERCDTLANRILQILALALEVEELDIFTRHRAETGRKNRTTLKFLHYPAVLTDLRPDQVRLGEHTDFGFVTLLFQDTVGGLEIQTRDGGWIPGTPIPGTLLVNIGDAMQRWTANRLKATLHRVNIPQDAEGRKKERRSIAFFLHPDDDWLLTCMNSSEVHSPIKYKDFLDAKFSSSTT